MIIETERLILRPFTENDAADAFEYLHEPMVHCFACMKTETMEDARKAVLDRAKDGEYYFAITLKENGKVIGEIDAMPEATAPDEENAVRDTFSPCWMLNPEYHGKGYAYEAAHAAQQPAGRVGNPPDIANMVLYLCSDVSGFITGENICIDGGMTRQMIYHGDHGWSLS